jgi:hypothetical protein
MNKVLFVLIFLFFSSKVVFAQNTEIISQTPTQTHTPTPTIAAPVAWPNEILNLQLNLNESSYKLNQNNINLGAYLWSAEQMINDACLEISPNKNFEKVSPTSKCNTLINDILKIDPENPAATCAKFGFKSVECFDSYTKVTNILLTSNSPAVNQKDVLAFIAAQEKINIKELDTINKLTFEYSDKKNSQNQAKLTNYFHKLVKQFCTPYAYEIKTSKTIEEPTPTNQKSLDNLTILLDNIHKPVSEPKKTVPTHLRLVPANCLEILKRAKQALPNSSPVICGEQGYYSPNCRKIALIESTYFNPKQKDMDLSSDNLGKF